MDEYPNNSESFMDPPKEREEAEAKENKKLTSSVGAMQDVIDWIDKCIAFYDSVDSLDVTEKTPPQEAVVKVTVARRMKASFETQKASLMANYKELLREEPMSE